MDKYLHQLFETFLAFLGGLTPAALGAAVSLAYEKGLTWSDRFVQFAVGVCVSYFAGGVIAAIWPWKPIDPFVLQGITFTLGMIAFKATPRFISSASDVVAGLPGDILRRIFPRKDGE